MNRDIFDFYIQTPATFGDVYNKKPPMNDYGIGAYIAIAATLAATAASTYVSVQQSEKAAEQSKLNAEAEAKALKAEADRQQAEFEENQRRLSLQQKKFRQQQLRSILNSGIQAGTGTALALEADTWSQQQRELNDREYLKNVTRDELQYKAASALTLGAIQSSQYKAQGKAAIVNGIGSAISSGASFYANTPKKTNTAKTNTTGGGTILSSSTVSSSGK